MKRSKLGTSVAGAVALGVLLTAGLYVVSTRYLIASRWPWDLDPQLENVQLDTLRLVLSLVAGIGAVVGLVIAYRRQDDLENRRFTEEFTNAVRLMASPEIAESVAGAHAMAAAINGTRDRARRQLGVDQLCGYLRLSNDPSRDPYLDETLTARDTVLGAHSTERRTFKTREEDMRKAVLSTIVNHRQRIPRTLMASLRARFAGTHSWNDCRIDLTGADLRGQSLNGVNFRSALLGETNLSGANLLGADLSGAWLGGCTCQGGHLVNVDLRGARVIESDFSSSDLSWADFRKAVLDEVDLRGTTLWSADFRGVRQPVVDFRGADVAGADWRGVDLSHVDLSGADWGDGDITGPLCPAEAVFDDDTRWPDGYLPPEPDQER